MSTPREVLVSKNAWDKLINHAVNSETQRSFNVSLEITVGEETWSTYGADVSHREILFFCKEGTVSYVVDTYGDRHTVELFDWDKSE